MFSAILAFFILGSIFSDTTNEINLTVWLDRDDYSFAPGERLKIYFQTDDDCYVAVYNIDAGGRENLLFPLPGESGQVQKGKIYELPPPEADYDYQITGPEGIEKIIVLAAKERLPSLADSEAIKKEIELVIEEPEPAKLRILSMPPRCKIYITEVESGIKKYIGRTPRTIVLSPGEYLVEIKKWGYQTIKRRIRLEPNERRRIYVHLSPW
ncbi:MAG: DUF4384 domain-containing protein [candidate division WOR-3 bacterium]